ncbi:MAG: helix-turn-helix domain-containing protein [Anaerolineae bacterium]
MSQTPAPYVEIPPHPALTPYVQCFWRIAFANGVLVNRILPDGCTDIVFQFDRSTGSAEIIGTMQQAAVLPLECSSTFIGVRFKPGGAAPFLRLPLHELTNSTLELELLWGHQGRGLLEKLTNLPSLESKLNVLQAALLDRLRLLPEHDLPLLDALDNIYEWRGQINVAALVSSTGWSERHLERRFHQHVGLSPKAFIRVIRFRSAARLLQTVSPKPLAAVAYASGYTDQAHFIHDFKRFAGVTPGSFVAEQQRVGFLQYSPNISDYPQENLST